MGKSVLEELVTVLGFEVDDDDLKSFNKMTEEAHGQLKKIAAVGGAAAAGIGVFIHSIASATDETFKFAKTLGASFEEVQRLTHATNIMGGEAGDVVSTLTNLAKITSSAAKGLGGGDVFGFLGLDARDSQGNIKESVDLLGEVADRIKALPTAAEQTDFASRLGISPNMILLLRQGSSGIKKLGAELDSFGFILTKEQGETAEKYVDSMVRGQLAARGLANQLGLRLMPAVTEISDKFTEWVSSNKQLIDSGLDDWAENILKFARPLAIFFGVAALSAAGLTAALNPKIAAFTILSGLITLMADDYMRYKEGVEGTVTGEVMKNGHVQNFLEAQKETGKWFMERIRALDKSMNLGVIEGGAVPSGISTHGRNDSRSGSTTINYNIHATDPNAVVTGIESRAREFNNAIQNLHGGSLA
jgi:hypothetical protein